MAKYNESQEMYLETILVLSKELKRVRAIDVSKAMSYSKPSVSRALKLLEDNHDIEIVNNTITLTEKGFKIADKIYCRHKTLSTFFESIGVEETIAVNDACKIEHVISDETMEKIKKLIKTTS